MIEYKLVGLQEAAHNDLERNDRGECKFMGFVVKFGSFSIYHSGDTLMHEGLESSLSELGPFDLMMLPINGNKPERRVAGNLDGEEAARLANTCGASLVVPCHYEMFTFNTASPELFERTCEGIGQNFRVMRSGERLTIGG